MTTVNEAFVKAEAEKQAELAAKKEVTAPAVSVEAVEKAVMSETAPLTPPSEFVQHVLLEALDEANKNASTSIKNKMQALRDSSEKIFSDLSAKVKAQINPPVKNWKWWGKRVGVAVAILYGMLIGATAVVPDGAYTYKGTRFTPTGMEHTLQTSKWFGLSHDTYKGNIVKGWEKQ